MMVPSAAASDAGAAAATFDRPLRSASSDPGDAASDSSLVASGPDVVVTLGRGTPAGSSTYDASGKMSAGLTLEQLGANAPDSIAKATESDGDDAASDAAGADQDAAVSA